MDCRNFSAEILVSVRLSFVGVRIFARYFFPPHESDVNKKDGKCVRDTEDPKANYSDKIKQFSPVGAWFMRKFASLF